VALKKYDRGPANDLDDAGALAPSEPADGGTLEAEVQHARLFVWNGSTWDRMTQPGGGGGGGGDGAILDGVSATIKATVKDYTNSNPLTAVLVDTNGDPYTAGGSSGLTDAQLRATAVPVTTPLASYSASVSANGAAITITNTTDYAMFSVVAEGTYSADYFWEASEDGSNWHPANAVAFGEDAAGLFRTSTNVPYLHTGLITAKQLRIRVANYVSGTLNIYLTLHAGPVAYGIVSTNVKNGQVGWNSGFSGNPVHIGVRAKNTAPADNTDDTVQWPWADLKGRLHVTGDASMVALKVDGSAVTQPVSGTFWQATQPVSGPLTDAQLRAVAVPVSGTFFQATQPVSLATNTPDVTDRDARLLGRAKILDSSGAVIDPALKGQLPAALVGGRLSVDASGVAVPVTDNAGSLTVDAPVGTPLWVRLSDGAAAFVGQKTMAASLPVVIASDQSAVPVSGPLTDTQLRASAVPVVSDVDHDAANTLKNFQIAGEARAADTPPAAVSAVGDRVRAHFDRYGSQIVRRRKIKESYTAVFRLAEAAARLDQTFTLTANTNKQWATLHHAASATKQLSLQKVVVFITTATTVAPQGIVELRELSVTTPPATGNPAITGRPRYVGAAAHEATALYLPTTQGSEAAVNSPLAHFVTDEAASVATAAMIHPQGYGSGGIVLFDASTEDDQVISPTVPLGVYGGWAVMTRFTGATVLRLTVLMVFTEEIP
jgi:hypothetical protein